MTTADEELIANWHEARACRLFPLEEARALVRAGDRLASRLQAGRDGGWDDAAVGREEIARVIDPLAFNTMKPRLGPLRRTDALAKADVILALLKRAALNAAAPKGKGVEDE